MLFSRDLIRSLAAALAGVNGRFDLSTMDALIHLVVGNGLCRHIPIWLNLRPVTHLRIATVIPQRSPACWGYAIANGRSGGGKSQDATSGKCLLTPATSLRSRPPRLSVRYGENPGPATQRNQPVEFGQAISIKTGQAVVQKSSPMRSSKPQ